MCACTGWHCCPSQKPLAHLHTRRIVSRFLPLPTKFSLPDAICLCATTISLQVVSKSHAVSFSIPNRCMHAGEGVWATAGLRATRPVALRVHFPRVRDLRVHPIASANSLEEAGRVGSWLERNAAAVAVARAEGDLCPAGCGGVGWRMAPLLYC